MQKIRNTEGVFMLGIIYCLLAVLIGKEAAGMFFASGDGKNNPFDAKNISYADNRKVEEAQKRQRLLERRNRSFTGMCS